MLNNVFKSRNILSPCLFFPNRFHRYKFKTRKVDWHERFCFLLIAHLTDNGAIETSYAFHVGSDVRLLLATLQSILLIVYIIGKKRYDAGRSAIMESRKRMHFEIS